MLKNGIPAQHYYELLEWKFHNFNDFLEMFEGRGLCDLTPEELTKLYNTINNRKSEKK